MSAPHATLATLARMTSRRFVEGNRGAKLEISVVEKEGLHKVFRLYLHVQARWRADLACPMRILSTMQRRSTAVDASGHGEGWKLAHAGAYLQARLGGGGGIGERQGWHLDVDEVAVGAEGVDGHDAVVLLPRHLLRVQQRPALDRPYISLLSWLDVGNVLSLAGRLTSVRALSAPCWAAVGEALMAVRSADRQRALWRGVLACSHACMRAGGRA